MDERSKYSKYSKSKLPSDKRTLPLRGSREDTGKYYMCWNCGFTCNQTRDAVGSGEGIQFVEYIDKPEGILQASQGGTGVEDVLITSDGGQAKNSIAPDVFSGCPFCGCKNYR